MYALSTNHTGFVLSGQLMGFEKHSENPNLLQSRLALLDLLCSTMFWIFLSNFVTNTNV